LDWTESAGEKEYALEKENIQDKDYVVEEHTEDEVGLGVT
jgi:hypothetical protein